MAEAASGAVCVPDTCPTGRTHRASGGQSRLTAQDCWAANSWSAPARISPS